MNWLFRLLPILSLISFLSCKQEIKLSGKFVCVSTDSGVASESTQKALDLAMVATGGEPIYSMFDFKGKNTVVINSKYGEVVTNYSRDEDYLKIAANNGDLLLHIINDTTLEGEGFAKGLYVLNGTLLVKERKKVVSDKPQIKRNEIQLSRFTPPVIRKEEENDNNLTVKNSKSDSIH